MVMWIVVAASAFASVYQGLGAVELIHKTLTNLDINRWAVLIIMQIIWALVIKKIVNIKV